MLHDPTVFEPPRLAPGLQPLDADTGRRLRDLRWRQRSPDRFRLGGGLTIALLLHGIFLWVLWQEMRPRITPSIVHLQLVDALQVRFIARPGVVHASPPPALPPPPLPRPRHHEPPRKDALVLQTKPPPSTAALQLYGKDGQVVLPAASASSGLPGYVAPVPAGDAQIMRHRDPIKYQATRFDQYFPPADETLGGSVVRHVVDAVVHTTPVDLPHGVHLQCKTVLGIPLPDCIMPPPPASPKNGDERLNMAPTRALAPEPHPRTPPSEASCIRSYRAGEPLPWGCPVDTPNRAVDEEMRQRSAGGTDPP